MTLVRVFDGVSQQVEQHLAHPRLVGTDHRQVRIERLHQFYGLGADEGGGDRRGIRDDLLQIDVAQFQIHLARPELADVEYVGDQPQQMLAARVDGLYVLALCLGELAIDFLQHHP